MSILKQATNMNLSEAPGIILIVSLLLHYCSCFKRCDNIQNEQFYDGLMCRRCAMDCSIHWDHRQNCVDFCPAWLTVAPHTAKGTTLGITVTPGSSGPTLSLKPAASEEQKYLEPGEQHNVMITILSIIGLVILASALMGVLYFSCAHLRAKIKKLSNFVRSKKTDSNRVHSFYEESLRPVDLENQNTESGHRSSAAGEEAEDSELHPECIGQSSSEHFNGEVRFDSNTAFCPPFRSQRVDKISTLPSVGFQRTIGRLHELQSGGVADIGFLPESRNQAEYTDAGSPVAQANETETIVKETVQTMESNV